MKKAALYIIFLTTIVSCSENYCGFIENNKETLSQLLILIEKNPAEFSNTQAIPRTYYTYNYQKEFSEFEKTKSAKNIDTKEYKALRDIFDELSIEKLIIYDSQNILFKVENVDFFVSDYNIYIGHLRQTSAEEIKKNFEVMDYKECVSKWYYILERTSIAN